MTVTKGLALLVSVTLAGVLVRASEPADSASSSPRLTAISSRANGRGASIQIETSVPVPYVATRPDPLTVLLDFRNVDGDGLANSVAAAAKGPIAAIAVEPGDSLGAPGARVRISLAQPVGYHVRSERTTIFVDFDKPSAKAQTYVLPPTSRQQVPDAMQALAQKPAGDPIAALGLAGASAAQSAPIALPAAAAAVTPLAAQAAGSATVRPQTPAAAPEAVQTPTDQPPTGKRYTGHPISLDFQGVDLRSVLRVFAEESGLNIVIDPAVQGTVDVALHAVPWDQALDIILRANKLGYIVDGTIVRIAPLTVLAEEETQKRKLSDEQALAGDLRVFTKTLSYATAESLKDLITKSSLSPRGTVQTDTRTNTIIITDLADRLTTASDLLNLLDKPQPEVEIEARIVQTNKSFARALGIQWGFSGRAIPALGNTTNLAFPNSGTLSGRTGLQEGAPSAAGAAPAPVPTAVNLPATGATSAVGLQLGSVNGALNLDVALSALESSGNGRLLSTPRVTMQNNVEAEIAQGVQIPIQTIANNTVTVSFKDATLSLKVTPQITSANTVIMKIVVENASPDFSRSVGGIPPINTQRANTQVLVSDGQTTVIGGIYVSQEQANSDKTPGLGSIPLLKWLFKRESVNDTSTELLIFITPKIIKG
jgi:type IV pilus assembly protein PilQ